MVPTMKKGGGKLPKKSKEAASRNELTAYCFGIRKSSGILNPELVTLKNGRRAVKGLCKDAPQYKVFRILSEVEAEEFQKSQG